MGGCRSGGHGRAGNCTLSRDLRVLGREVRIRSGLLRLWRRRRVDTSLDEISNLESPKLRVSSLLRKVGRKLTIVKLGKHVNEESSNVKSRAHAGIPCTSSVCIVHALEDIHGEHLHFLSTVGEIVQLFRVFAFLKGVHQERLVLRYRLSLLLGAHDQLYHVHSAVIRHCWLVLVELCCTLSESFAFFGEGTHGKRAPPVLVGSQL
mmetsp:Transcript_25158/g.65932  ORF Transcript_25158/g.65932 Transcript_25158/m.65932 type:complete len:206 (+) Transcript_25158:615-1232(+)